MVVWDDFFQQMTENRNVIEKSVVITYQCVLLIFIITILNKYALMSTKKLLLLIFLQLCVLVTYNITVPESYNKLREETLLIIYESKIRDKNITENDISKIAFKYLYYDLPIRLFIYNIKKLFPILIAIALFGKIITSKKETTASEPAPAS